ncbi:hypothetical protein, partial [Fulvivirga lutimaris]|uniref:hypothetical protein n=1 Tax=Fulvivirga lutimaris TaxID=1819566 RepID=UPI001626B9AD
CTHSARNALADDKDLQSNKNLKLKIKDLHSGYVNRQERSLDDLYDEIIEKGNTEYYGSVHVLRLRDLPIIIERFGPSARNYNVVNVVRHPVDLVWSGYGQFLDLFLYDINELYWTTGKVLRDGKEFCYQLARKYDLNLGEYNNLAFLGACAVLSSLKLDMDAYSKLDGIHNLNLKKTFKMEDLTKSEKSFSEFISQLCGDDFEASQDYIRAVFNEGVINKHKHDNKKLSPAKRYDQFSMWQKEAFEYFFDFNQLLTMYEKIGYDFSFLNNN